MMTKVKREIRIADWHDPKDQAAIRNIREQVFIREQNVPAELEWDELDAVCIHLLVSLPGGKAIATSRILFPETGKNAYIGRISVLAEYRHQGIASDMLNILKEITKKNNTFEMIQLNAQTTAIPFYTQHGFSPVGEEFLDADIPHYKMFYTIKM